MAGVFGRPLSSGALGVFVQTAGAVALLLGIAAGRAGWPAGTLLEPRYTVLTSLVVALACVALSRGRAGAVVSAVVLFGTLVFLPRNWAEAAQEKERANASFAVVRETAGLRVPVECVAQKWWGNLPAREPILARVLAVCAARGIGPYAGLPAPLDARELTELQLDVSKTSGPPFEFALPRAMNVAGVRVRIRMSDDSVMQNIVTPTDDPDGPYLQPAKLDPAARATPTLRWDDARSPRVFTDERLVKLANRLPRNGKAEVVFWSTARVSTIRFEPDARPLDCSVESVSVLVMPDEWARVLNLSIGERR